MSGGADGALGFDSCKGVSGISGYLICVSFLLLGYYVGVPNFRKLPESSRVSITQKSSKFRGPVGEGSYKGSRLDLVFGG